VPATQGDDVSGNSAGVAHGEDDQDERAESEQRGLRGDCGCGFGEDLDAAGKVAGNRAGAQAEEVFDLGAGDEGGDAVGEADDHRAGINFTAMPRPVTPSRTRIAPAMRVQTARPLGP